MFYVLNWCVACIGLVCCTYWTGALKHAPGLVCFMYWTGVLHVLDWFVACTGRFVHVLDWSVAKGHQNISGGYEARIM